MTLHLCKIAVYGLSVSLIASTAKAEADNSLWLKVEQKVGCSVTVSGTEYLGKKCTFRRFADGSITIEGRKKQGYFFQLDPMEGDARDAFWSGPDKRATHAHHYLGLVKKVENCWINPQTRICISEDVQ